MQQGTWLYRELIRNEQIGFILFMLILDLNTAVNSDFGRATKWKTEDIAI